MDRPSAPRLVRCPTCGGDSRYEPSNPFRPFCSRRCREIDLGGWASERFRVAAAGGSDAGDDAANEAGDRPDALSGA